MEIAILGGCGEVVSRLVRYGGGCYLVGERRSRTMDATGCGWYAPSSLYDSIRFDSIQFNSIRGLFLR